MPVHVAKKLLIASALVLVTACSKGSGASGPTTLPAGVPATVPSTAEAWFEDVLKKLDAAHDELAAIVQNGDLANAHHVAQRMVTLSARLPTLASKRGASADAVKALSNAAQEIQEAFDPMDEAGDAGNREQSKIAFAKYDAPLKAIHDMAATAK